MKASQELAMALTLAINSKTQELRGRVAQQFEITSTANTTYIIERATIYIQQLQTVVNEITKLQAELAECRRELSTMTQEG